MTFRADGDGAVAGQPVRPVLVAGLQRLLDQQPAEATAVDEQVAVDAAAIVEPQRECRQPSIEPAPLRGPQFGGLANVMPVYTTIFVITTMASVGLPFLNGFVGEFLIMVGMFQSQALSITAGVNWNYIAAMLAGTGVIFAAVYLLWMVQRVFFGKVTNDKNRLLADLSWREIGLMVPLLILMVYMGVFPKPFLSRSENAIKALQERVMQRAGGTIDHADAKPGLADKAVGH